jgi:hypothetical protein
MQEITEIFVIAKPGQPPVGFAMTEKEATDELARIRSQDPNSWWRVLKNFFEMWERDNPLAQELQLPPKPRRGKTETEAQFKLRLQQWDHESRKAFDGRNEWERAKMKAGDLFVQNCFGYPDYTSFKLAHPRKKGAPEYELIRLPRLGITASPAQDQG